MGEMREDLESKLHRYREIVDELEKEKGA
jgi:hypothetical protein